MDCSCKQTHLSITHFLSLPVFQLSAGTFLASNNWPGEEMICFEVYTGTDRRQAQRLTRNFAITESTLTAR